MKTSVHTYIAPNYRQLIVECCSNPAFNIARWNAFIEQLNIYLLTENNFDSLGKAAKDFDMTDNFVYRAVYQNYHVLKSDRYGVLGALVTADLLEKTSTLPTQVHYTY